MSLRVRHCPGRLSFGRRDVWRTLLQEVPRREFCFHDSVLPSRIFSTLFTLSLSFSMQLPRCSLFPDGQIYGHRVAPNICCSTHGLLGGTEQAGTQAAIYCLVTWNPKINWTSVLCRQLYTDVINQRCWKKCRAARRDGGRASELLREARRQCGNWNSGGRSEVGVSRGVAQGAHGIYGARPNSFDEESVQSIIE